LIGCNVLEIAEKTEDEEENVFWEIKRRRQKKREEGRGATVLYVMFSSTCAALFDSLIGTI
jgi:hypothetical protein